jgi:hypothetical protein
MTKYPMTKEGGMGDARGEMRDAGGERRMVAGSRLTIDEIANEEKSPNDK